MEEKMQNIKQDIKNEQQKKPRTKLRIAIETLFWIAIALFFAVFVLALYRYNIL